MLREYYVPLNKRNILVTFCIRNFFSPGIEGSWYMSVRNMKTNGSTCIRNTCGFVCTLSTGWRFPLTYVMYKRKYMYHEDKRKYMYHEYSTELHVSWIHTELLVSNSCSTFVCESKKSTVQPVHSPFQLWTVWSEDKRRFMYHEDKRKYMYS